MPLRESDGYKEDVLGLQTLDKADKLRILSYAGEHMQFSAEWWAATVLPHLGP